MTVVADSEVRVRALDPQRSFIVQAPAGAGKTELLIQRLLALLACVRRPDEVLAITFTRKAAAEMRHRLLQALDAAAGPPPEPSHQRLTWNLGRAVLARDQECGWDLLGAPGQLGIQTVDSFNASLVRRMPWVSRFGGLPAIAEDPRALLREAVRRTLDRVAAGGRGGEAGARLLTHLDNRMERLTDMLTTMLARRDQWLRHLAGSGAGGDRTTLERALAAHVGSLLGQARALVPEGMWPTMAETARFAAGHLEKMRPLQALESLAGIPDASPEQLPLWQGLADLFLTAEGSLRRRVDKNCGFPPGGNATFARHKSAMQQLLGEPALARLAPVLDEIRRLPDPRYQEEQWRILQALVELLRLAVAELSLVFSERGEVDFAEVALRALSALRQEGAPSDLLLQLDSRINHILVDEFQDTSYLQFALLEQLTEGWQPGDGRTLFVVGDPMQSIYRFREAEVGLFLQAQRSGIGSVAFEPLQLSTNFRSQAGLLDWINQSFPGLFPENEDVARGAVRYAPTRAFHPTEFGTAVQVHPLVGRDDQREALTVVELINEALSSGYRSVAILGRTRSHLASILPALRAAGLRYLARDVDPLADRPVARDLVALTRALLHAADHLSWLSVLRAPWCGLPLQDLHALCRVRGDRTIPHLLADPQVGSRLSPDGKTRLDGVFPILQHARRQVGRIGLRRLVEGCWLGLGGPACWDGTSREDAARVFELLDTLDAGGDLPSLEALDEGLAQLYAAPDAEADGRLQIMTIHKAKGLEFDCVILPGLGRSPAMGDPPLLRWLEHPGSGLLLAPIAPRGGSKDPVYDAIGRLEKDKEGLETVRLLYVAATRARHRLHLLGHAETDAAGQPRPAAGSLLDKLWPVLARTYGEWRGATAAVNVAGSDRRLPRLRRLTSPRPFTIPAPVPAPSEIQAGRPAPEKPGTAERLPKYAFQSARKAGTVLHLLLERIGREGLGAWSEARINGLRAEVGHRLVREGMARDEVASWTGQILQGLGLAISGKRGRWILHQRPGDACEFAVVSAEAGLGIIDRTFVEDGVRWIIDYKSTLPEGKDLQGFFTSEIERYRPQLAAYGRVMAALDPGRPLRAGLYFPLFDGWCEVPLES